MSRLQSGTLKDRFCESLRTAMLENNCVNFHAILLCFEQVIRNTRAGAYSIPDRR